MKITERRLVEQQWYKTECTKTGWDSFGYTFLDDGNTMSNKWTVVNILDTDKHSNPTLAIVEKETWIK